MKHYAPNPILAPKDDSSQNIKSVRSVLNPAQKLISSSTSKSVIVVLGLPSYQNVLRYIQTQIINISKYINNFLSTDFELSSK